MDENKRYYATLGLQPGASKQQIKDAYRQLAKVWHPDQFQQDIQKKKLAEEKIKAVNEAYQKLKEGLGAATVSTARAAGSTATQGATATYTTRATTPWEHCEEGRKLAQQQEYQAAAEALKCAIRMSPDYAEAYRLRSLVYSFLNFEVRAGEDSDKAASLGISCVGRLERKSRTQTSSAHPQFTQLSCTAMLDNAPARLCCLSLSSNPKSIAAGGKDGKIYLWNLKTKRLFHQFTDHTDAVTSLVFSHDSQFLFSGSQDMVIKMFHLTTGSLSKTFSGHQEGIVDIRLGQIDGLLASADSDGIVHVWNYKSGKAIRKLPDYKPPITALDLTQQGEVAIIGSHEGSIRILHLLRGGVLKWINQNGYSAKKILLNQNEGYFIALGKPPAGRDKIICYDFPSCQQLRTFEAVNSPIESLALINQNSILVGGDAKGSLHFWEISTGKLLSSALAHSTAITALFSNSQANLLVSLGRDGIIKIWQS